MRSEVQSESEEATFNARSARKPVWRPVWSMSSGIIGIRASSSKMVLDVWLCNRSIDGCQTEGNRRCRPFRAPLFTAYHSPGCARSYLSNGLSGRHFNVHLAAAGICDQSDCRKEKNGANDTIDDGEIHPANAQVIKHRRIECTAQINTGQCAEKADQQVNDPAAFGKSAR